MRLFEDAFSDEEKLKKMEVIAVLKGADANTKYGDCVVRLLMELPDSCLKDKRDVPCVSVTREVYEKS